MSYSIYLTLILATIDSSLAGDTTTPSDAGSLDDALLPVRERIVALVERFRRSRVSPLSAAKFEKALQSEAREFGRLVVEWTYNHLEPAAVDTLPARVSAAV